MTENELKELGFVLIKQYDHDQFHTNRFQKGVMEIEFTYDDEEMVSCDLTISEVNCMPVNLNQMKLITSVLGDYED